MSRYKLLPYFVLFVLATSLGCSDEQDAEIVQDVFRTVNIADSLGLDSGDATIFLLPAPLQVVSALKLYEVEYDASLISEFKKSEGIAQEYLNALNLGAHTIDLGYATVNGDIQLGLRYSQNVKSLMEELGISSIITANMIERFEANAANQDSLSKIILEAYGASHKFFQRNEREGIGLLILTGCFIEGLYIASSVKKISSNSRLQSLLGIHKEYLNNILTLIQYYKQSKEVAALIIQMEALKKEFENIDLIVNVEEGSAKLKTPVSAEDLASIRTKIKEIRTSIRK